jgi:hypothetical protein
MASVYVEAASSHQNAAYSLPGDLSGLWMTPVERANPNREGKWEPAIACAIALADRSMPST